MGSVIFSITIPQRILRFEQEHSWNKRNVKVRATAIAIVGLHHNKTKVSYNICWTCIGEDKWFYAYIRWCLVILTTPPYHIATVRKINKHLLSFAGQRKYFIDSGFGCTICRCLPAIHLLSFCINAWTITTSQKPLTNFLFGHIFWLDALYWVSIQKRTVFFFILLGSPNSY